MPISFHAQDNAYAHELERELGVSVLAPVNSPSPREVACTKHNSVIRSPDGFLLTLTPHRLGAGAHGIVKSGFLQAPDQPTPLLVAVKKVSLRSHIDYPRAANKVIDRGHREISKEFTSANACHAPLGASLLMKTDKKSYLVMPHVEGTYRDMTTSLAPATLAEAKSMFVAPLLFSELAYMHACGYSHLDIKAENVLFSGSDAHLADFGFAQRESVGAPDQDWYGTRWCSAPETLSPRGETLDLQKSDVFALGMTLFVGSTGDAGAALRDNLIYLTENGTPWRDYYRTQHAVWSTEVDQETGRIRDWSKLNTPTRKKLAGQFEACAQAIIDAGYRQLLLSTLSANPDHRPPAYQVALKVP